MNKFENEKKNDAHKICVVISPRIARQLIKMGYRIIDLKPHNVNKMATVFVFAIEGNIIKDFLELKDAEEAASAAYAANSH